MDVSVNKLYYLLDLENIYVRSISFYIIFNPFSIAFLKTHVRSNIKHATSMLFLRVEYDLQKEMQKLKSQLIIQYSECSYNLKLINTLYTAKALYISTLKTNAIIVQTPLLHFRPTDRTQ